MKQAKSTNVITAKEVAEQHRGAHSVWKKAAGLLKGKVTGDPVAIQRRLRKEWERKSK